ncbi:YkyA family protein [Neobacillus vireti]|uniref:YkyA family protein n=1 Tax=Neobacillus vireti TaxID=220686 RepID=UPI002FFE7351
MSISRISLVVLSVFAGVSLLTGCVKKERPAEEMYQVLEKVVEAEKEFEEQQQPLAALEKQEKEMYNQIMSIGLKQHDEIVKLSEEALLINEKRREHLQKEVDSIQASKTEFKEAEEIKSKIKDTQQKRKAEELFEIMTLRYKVHNQLSQEYTHALELDKELYIMLKDKNITFENLESQVTELNTTYKDVSEANEEFNKLTTQYNKLKLEYYEEAGLKLEK